MYVNLTLFLCKIYVDEVRIDFYVEKVLHLCHFYVRC